MILEPWKSAEEIERRLSAFNDPELTELLRSLNRDFSGTDAESYTAEDAPYWKKRISFVVLVGLLAMSAGYSFVAGSHPRAAAKHHPVAAVPAPAKHHAKPTPRHVAVTHHAAVVHPRPAVAAPVYVPTAPAPDEALVRQARAQLLHERMIAAQARAAEARAQHQAKLAMQAQAQAQARAQAAAVAQARAEEVAQARAQALRQAQSQAQAQADAQWEEQRLQMAKDAQIKPGNVPPPTTGHMGTYPIPSAPAPAPGPVIDPNCTPHRGSLFGTVLRNVRLGDTNVGAVLQLVHHP
jgi:hypothetical protein